jgi:hypothetical protein
VLLNSVGPVCARTASIHRHLYCQRTPLRPTLFDGFRACRYQEKAIRRDYLGAILGLRVVAILYYNALADVIASKESQSRIKSDQLRVDRPGYCRSVTE